MIKESLSVQAILQKAQLQLTRTMIYISSIRYPARQKYTGLGKLCGMIKEMIVDLRAIIGIYDYVLFQHGARGGVVVKALRYKPAGRGFDSRWCHWNFSVT